MKTKHTATTYTVKPYLTPEHDDDPFGVYEVECVGEDLQRRYDDCSDLVAGSEEEEKALAAVHAENQAIADKIALALNSHDALVAAMDRLSVAVEGLDSLRDDDSRAEAYADELKELSEAQDIARAALALAKGATP